jgi:hypothetical protein
MPETLETPRELAAKLTRISIGPSADADALEYITAAALLHIAQALQSQIPEAAKLAPTPPSPEELTAQQTDGVKQNDERTRAVDTMYRILGGKCGLPLPFVDHIARDVESFAPAIAVPAARYISAVGEEIRYEAEQGIGRISTELNKYIATWSATPNTHYIDGIKYALARFLDGLPSGLAAPRPAGPEAEMPAPVANDAKA